MAEDLQTPFDIGVSIVTVLRPSIAQALRSVYSQRFNGRIHVLVGIDRCDGERSMLEALVAERPANVSVTVLDLGYSTAQRNGGLYTNRYGGALSTILSYAANSRYIAYLDDDNWYAPDHLATMLAAIAGKAWSFSLRHFVDDATGDVLCPDTWESMGPGRGVYAQAQGGFVDTNCFCIDKIACHDVFPEWAVSRFKGGAGQDRQVFARLLNRPYGTNDAHTVFYRQRLAGHHPYLLWKFRCAGVDLARYMPPSAIPGEAVWQQCAKYDQSQAAAGQPPGAR
jgi:glycosyltransferase involved in cell wall biosynthesis